jgi:hypothetical protein
MVSGKFTSRYWKRSALCFFNQLFCQKDANTPFYLAKGYYCTVYENKDKEQGFHSHLPTRQEMSWNVVV